MEHETHLITSKQSALTFEHGFKCNKVGALDLRMATYVVMACKGITKC